MGPPGRSWADTPDSGVNGSRLLQLRTARCRSSVGRPCHPRVPVRPGRRQVADGESASPPRKTPDAAEKDGGLLDRGRIVSKKTLDTPPVIAVRSANGGQSAETE